ncbi:MAG TPA: ATP-binding protein, partial [Acidimicrobiales bacterium]|nr:ATP-binding protein [Acidimicrobiales bacterium]
PTEVNVVVQVRPSPALEAISYFCAAELLANVAQHAEASRASLTCAQHGPWLRIVVRDNGRGGAVLSRGGSSSSGLAGLVDRVGAVDGHLSIASPAGGPTVVTVDLPLHP